MSKWKKARNIGIGLLFAATAVSVFKYCKNQADRKQGQENLNNEIKTQSEQNRQSELEQFKKNNPNDTSGLRQFEEAAKPVAPSDTTMKVKF